MQGTESIDNAITVRITSQKKFAEGTQNEQSPALKKTVRVLKRPSLLRQLAADLIREAERLQAEAQAAGIASGQPRRARPPQPPDPPRRRKLRPDRPASSGTGLPVRGAGTARLAPYDYRGSGKGPRDCQAEAQPRNPETGAPRLDQRRACAPIWAQRAAYQPHHFDRDRPKMTC